MKNAALEVKAGRAVFERDSVLFFQEDYNEDFVQILLQVASENHGKLNLLDFGGSLGSVYFQYRKRLEQLQQVNWCVVEQDHFVRFGKEKLEDRQLRFFYTVEECLSAHPVHLCLLSSVISYLSDPYAFLTEVKAKRFPYVLIDRNIFTDAPDTITKQVVPEVIYRASYPCWILNRSKLIKFMEDGYELVKQFDPYGKAEVSAGGTAAYFSAMLFKRK